MHTRLTGPVQLPFAQTAGSVGSHKSQSENYSGFTNETLADTANYLNKAFGVLFLPELAIGLLARTSHPPSRFVGHNEGYILPMSAPSASFVRVTPHTPSYVYPPGLEEDISDLVNLDPV